MAKILILIGGHLCTAPRPQKEAETLANAGHEVIVRGFWFDPELVRRDHLLMANKKWQFQPILDFQPHQRLRNLSTRLRSSLSKEGFRLLGFFLPELLGYGTQMMLKVARQTCADLTIVHSEAGLWVGDQLLNDGFKIGVDFEDWFSEDLLPKDRVIRPIKHLKVLESRLARKCSYCLTTSDAMAEALIEAYQVPKPMTIYNSFPWAERSQIDHQKGDRYNLNLPSIHWFSQTIGPRRGLETLFQALPKLKTPVEIHLRGNYPDSYRQYFEPLVPTEWHHRLFIHPTVSNVELLSRIAEHDIGLALEFTDIPSRNLTVTNKLFQYIQAGLAVIATDTVGQREIFSQRPEIGRLIPSNNPSILAQALNDLLDSPDKLKAAKDAAIRAAKEQFCWEIESQKLVQAAEIALNQSGR
ncbi:MAG: glycosyltransferase [Rhizonema sp. NSF051]|nr:glycosyltransferase [Rhizonema sp. NSF051]